MESDSRDPKTPLPSASVIGAAAWGLPGLGYWLLGERVRGVTVGVTIICLFIGGLLIGGVRVLEVPTFDHAGQRIINATTIQEIRAKPWSIAQIMNGPIGIAAGALSVYSSRPDEVMPLVDPSRPFDPIANPHLPSGSDTHARTNEIAVLYTAVAGMLNLLVIIDCVHRAGQMSEVK